MNIYALLLHEWKEVFYFLSDHVGAPTLIFPASLKQVFFPHFSSASQDWITLRALLNQYVTPFVLAKLLDPSYRSCLSTSAIASTPMDLRPRKHLFSARVKASTLPLPTWATAADVSASPALPTSPSLLMPSQSSPSAAGHLRPLPATHLPSPSPGTRESSCKKET